MRKIITELIIGIVAAVVATLAVGAFQHTEPKMLEWIFGSIGGVLGMVAFFFAARPITKRVENSDTVWDGFALLILYPVVGTLFSVTGAAIGMWLASGVPG
ncbi:hypothetical protein [Microbacterium sp.]|uniref:hypothetical protein n=1 Tax=Microbacterium sp. TaxID=51671 RepID=UPI003736BA3A